MHIYTHTHVYMYIGVGTFGYVLLAKFRGSDVAVKKMIPPKVCEFQACAHISAWEPLNTCRALMAVRHGHSPRSQPAVTVRGHSLRSQSAVTARSPRSQPAVTVHSHSPRS